MHRMEIWKRHASLQLEQIGGNNYIDILEEDGVEKILKYGIAFYKKRCRVMIGENPDAG